MPNRTHFGSTECLLVLVLTIQGLFKTNLTMLMVGG